MDTITDFYVYLTEMWILPQLNLAFLGWLVISSFSTLTFFLLLGNTVDIGKFRVFLLIASVLNLVGFTVGKATGKW
jgi:hypothetical protein